MDTETGTATAPDLAGLSGGWQVEPEQVRAFATSVADVRQDLELLRRAAAEVAADPPLLGTSPIGDGLAAKFVDRAGNAGLVGELNRVIAQLEAFVASAERTVAEYQERDGTAARSLRAR
ncbi:MAG TPA: hypothetical protein VGD67_03820 [Pseudonocardiaceae bacterium]